MWEDHQRESRKYVVPTANGHAHANGHHHQANGNAGHHQSNGLSAFNYGYDRTEATEDLHAWSIFRQNLNADLSESAIGLNSKSADSQKPFGNFQLKESTVNNILSHPKYGPSLKNHDPYTYLRFGLPRVKPTTAQSEIGVRALGGNMSASGAANHPHRAHGSSHGMTSDSNSVSDEEASPYTRRRARRVWKSNPDLGQTDADGHPVSSHRPQQNGHSKSNGVSSPNGHAKSEIDLRYTGNGSTLANGNGYAGFGSKVNSLPNGSSNGGAPKHPHLIIRNLYYEVDKTSTFRRFCGAQRQKLRVLDNISLEVRAGEILAIMATNAVEGTAILDVMSNRYCKSRSKVKGDFILNGAYLNPSKLSELVAYVNQETELCPEMTARQTLLFTSLVQKPAKRNDFDTKKRTNALLEELGLSEVRHSSVSSLTEAEKRRLLIAVSLLLDTDILLLDQPTKGMDIFDTFFLVEYLRQWALISGRCVIMTINPATYEIFTMLSRIALVSTGRILFHGKRKDLLSYFTQIDYPCPAFKNPSDYYLDLVTLDNLSAEAMLESSQRVENLVELYSRRFSNGAVSMPGPPSVTPPPTRRAALPMQFLALWIRALIFTFPYNVIHLFRNVFVALLLSIMCGIIYWHVRVGREQEHLWDRIGFYHAMLAVVPLPLFLIIINDAHKEKQFVLNEVKHGFYSRAAYLSSKLIYSLPQATLAFVAFALPASSMAGLHQDLSWYLLFMLAYLHALRMIALCSAWAFNSRTAASIFFGLIFALMTLAAGTTIHFKDLSVVTKWLYFASPTRWTHEALVGWEFSSNVTLALTTASSAASTLPYQCSHNPIIQQENAILIKADCGIQTRSNILSWFAYKGGHEGHAIRALTHPFIGSAVAFGVFFVLATLSFCFLSTRKRDSLRPTLSNQVKR